MKLAIRTSSGAFGVGLFSADNIPLVSREAERAIVRSGNVGQLLDALLDGDRAMVRRIDAIFVDLGPGGLSSTRAGVSFANALSFATCATLYGISALEQQCLDVRSRCSLPLISTRPAPGQRMLWGFYPANTLAEAGLDFPVDVLTRFSKTYDRLAVAGPLHQFAFDEDRCNRVTFFHIDPPHLSTLLTASPIPCRNNGKLSLLHPITSPQGLSNE